MRSLAALFAVVCFAWFRPMCAVAEDLTYGQANEQIPPYHTHHDRRHGHDHVYPDRGAVVRDLPRGSIVVNYAGFSYRFAGGVWYERHGPAYIVVAPPIGLVVPTLPAFATSISAHRESYLYVNDTYYRARPDLGGYEVVNDPADTGSAATKASAAAEPRADAPAIAPVLTRRASESKGAAAHQVASNGTASREPAPKEPKEPAVKDSAANETAAQDPVTKEPAVQDPLAKQPAAQDSTAKDSAAGEAPTKELAASETAAAPPAAPAPSDTARQAEHATHPLHSVAASAAPAANVSPPPSALPSAVTKLSMSPRNGQSPDEQARDRYECYRFAVAQSGFDPLRVDGGVSSADAAQRQADYVRAQAACLEEHGYTLR